MQCVSPFVSPEPLNELCEYIGKGGRKGDLTYDIIISTPNDTVPEPHLIEITIERHNSKNNCTWATLLCQVGFAIIEWLR